MKKIAVISLPKINTPIEEGFSNLHGYWNPPAYVMLFWLNGCQVEYLNDDDYEMKKKKITESYLECINQFYRENAL